ncbi:MAG: hypothetical protein OEL87_03115 [Nanoarchaeota archaeon]|nr:hypothetical protein [Nanoarchaeota archaeon]
MKKLTQYKILTVFCKCGEKLVRYKKGPGRRLLKIHRDRITKDYTNILKNYAGKETKIFCPSCKERFATVKCVNGKYVNKINQGQLGKVK